MHLDIDVTLAVIVKNEAPLLKELLTHHKSLYDEAIVVDTGSSDSSIAVARELGAVVHEFPWQDDFSAARNFGLEKAQGQWILQLDCDERIAPEEFSIFKSLAAQPADHVLAFPTHNYVSNPVGGDWFPTSPSDHKWCNGARGYFRTHPIRLFPNDPQLRFSGIIHENLEDSISLMGLVKQEAPVTIHHTGLLCGEGRIRREKLYSPLLLKKFEQSPYDIRAVTELARFLVGKKQWETAEKLLNHGLNQSNESFDEPNANLLMVEIESHLGKKHQALNRLEKTINQRPDQLLCWSQAVKLSLEIGDFQKAGLYFENGRRLFPQSPVLKDLESELKIEPNR